MRLDKMILRLALFTAAITAAKAFSILDRRELLGGVAASLTLPSSFPSINLSAAKAAPAAKTTKGKSTIPALPLDYSGVYRDPKHPSGYRVIRSTAGDGGAISVTLQDEPNGKTMKLTGTSKYNKRTGETDFVIDFSPKGGPSSLSASYSSDRLLLVNFCAADSGKEVLTRGSISFPSDGNVWVKDPGIQGVYADPNHPDGYRVIRDLGSAKLSIELADRVNQKPTFLSGVVNKNEGTVLINFTPKGGPKKLSAMLKENKLIFPDGNVWTKL